MKKVAGLLSVSFCATLITGTAWAAAEPFKSDLEKKSYAIGANMAKQLKQRETTFDVDAMVKGIQEEASGKGRLTDEEVSAIMKKVRDDAQKKALEDYEKLVSENKTRGQAYRSAFAGKEGVKTLPGGVLYRVLKAGEGKKPTEDDTVLCNYSGRLVDGKVFDASEPGKPATFKLDQLIPGWLDALLEMPVGSKWEIVIPPEKAYGARGNGKNIGPHDTLVFEVELVAIQ